jgi:putative ABC transport system permease protein
MALLIMIFRKMMKNKWLELSLLTGLTLSVALAASIPIYTEAILQKMLIRDLEQKQKDSNWYPGGHFANILISDQSLVKTTDDFLLEEAFPSFGISLQSHVKERRTPLYNFVPADPGVDATVNRVSDIAAVSELEDHIRLLDGHLPSSTSVNGVYEALVVEGALTKLHLTVGQTFVIRDGTAPHSIKVKVVGVVTHKEPNDLYWTGLSLTNYKSTFLIPFILFEQDITLGSILPIAKGSWYTALDYTEISAKHIDKVINGSREIKQYFNGITPNNTAGMPAVETIVTFTERKGELLVLLWSLYVPVFFMLGCYLFMMSLLLVERQKTEISVLKSRGAGLSQILFSYLLPGLIQGFVALLIGPLLGMLFAKVLGLSNGFLAFVQREAMDVSLTGDAYFYGSVVAVLSLVMILFPVYLAAKSTIVTHKQASARANGKMQRVLLAASLLLLGIALYGLEKHRDRLDTLLSLGLNSSELSIDPLLFVVPSLFIIGLGLLLLQLYPYIIRLIFWLGNKWWNAPMYAILTQVSRSARQYQFIMIFLIMTMAIGLFSASSARTIHQNMEERIRYSVGADVVITPLWESRNIAPAGRNSSNLPAAAGNKERIYIEPPFLPYSDLPGVESVAQVFTKEDVYIKSGASTGVVDFMGIVTNDFGRTAWFRDGLLTNHLNEYLNLIAQEPSAVLISKTLAEQKAFKVGDTIHIELSPSTPIHFIVYGIVDYFPTFNPYLTGSQGERMLVVGQLDYIRGRMVSEPYNIWMKLKPNVSIPDLSASIVERGIRVEAVTDVEEKLFQFKNDPFQLAIGGVMTLGFLICMMISMFGFLLFWIMSLQGRLLQIGVLSAMGMPRRQLLTMLLAEQVLTSAAAVLIGTITGFIVTRLYVPMFQMSFDAKAQVPPFKVIADPQDFTQLHFFMFALIFTGLAVLSLLLIKIKIYQAIKLGED